MKFGSRFLTVNLLVVALVLTGCASTSPIPDSTVKQIASTVLERETVSLSPKPEEQVLEDVYYLGPGDVLFVNVSNKSEFSSFVAQNGNVGSRIEGKGVVNIPLIITVPVTEKTTEQAQNTIREAVCQYLQVNYA